MTFQEFTHLPMTGKREQEIRELLLQSIAIISGQGRFRKMTLDKIFDFVVKQASEVNPAGCSNCREAGEPTEGLAAPAT